MDGKLTFMASYQSSRPSACRHCGQAIGYGSPALVDLSEPWLAIHADCVRALLPERVEQLYLDLETANHRWRSASSEFKKRIETLRNEIEWLDRFSKNDKDSLPEFVRPGRLRVSVGQPKRR